MADPSTIDEADIVLRFNKAQHCGVAGMRTDILVLVNWSGPGEGFARSPECIAPLARKNAKTFWLTNDPKDLHLFRVNREAGLPGDFSDRIRRKIVRHRPFRYMPAENRIDISEKLIALGARHDVIPSSGAQVINLLLHEAPEARIDLYGFSFEGWDGHCWAAERQWATSVARVQLQPPLTR